jgi:carbon storage regulator
LTNFANIFVKIAKQRNQKAVLKTVSPKVNRLKNHHEREFMLVLTRKTRESILIGHDIRVTIDRIDGQRVRIGIEAPEGVKILREELADLPEAKKSAKVKSAE